MQEESLIYPHCDPGVIHAPKECEVCDMCPKHQEFRKVMGINYTGHYDGDKLPCPSERRRPLAKINRWPGNRPQKAGK